MELKMNDYQLPEKISFNFDELKQELTEKVSMYETLVYTDDQIKEAKADKAQLNKLKKALNDERIRLEKEYMQPFNSFKSQVNEIISIIDKPVALIDKQVKEYEDKQKQDKMEQIKALWVNNMLSFNNGVMEIRGNIPTICTDLSMLIREINKLLSENLCEEAAHEMIMHSVELGLKSDNEIQKEILKRLKGEL